MPSTHTPSSEEKADVGLDGDVKSSSGVLARTQTHTPTPTASSAHAHAAPTTSEEHDFSSIDEKKLNRKIDLKIVPWLTFLYLLSFLDRSAIGNAKLFGLSEDLGLRNVEYNICVCIFYFRWVGAGDVDAVL